MLLNLNKLDFSLYLSKDFHFMKLLSYEALYKVYGQSPLQDVGH